MNLTTVLAWAVFVFAPAAAYAQASITGVVTDVSGAVLPGVTVEASSPALIEKTRTAVTDGTGQYRIVDLRPGTYSVTFALLGFSSVRREDVELTGSFTVVVNAQMRVGVLQETVTVTGEAPVVDVQSARRQQVLNNDVLAAIPSGGGGTSNGLLNLIPGVTTTTNDITIGPMIVYAAYHGGPNSEGRLTVDGNIVGSAGNGNSMGSYAADVGNSQEVTFTTSGGLGESESAGATMNIVPRTGANTSSGSFLLNGANGALTGSNYTQELKDLGVRAPSALSNVWDVNGAFGGAIRKDRLWYFGNARSQGLNRDVQNLYLNKNAGDPTKWTYIPDLNQQAFSDRNWVNASLRLTWQATPRNKLNLFWDEQNDCWRCTGYTPLSGTPDPLTAPEAQGVDTHIPRVRQASWTAPATSRLLLEAGVSNLQYAYDLEREGNVTQNLTRMVEQCSAGCPANGNIPGLTYRSLHRGSFGNWNAAYNWRAALSYVTGAHSLKVGYIGYMGVSNGDSFVNTTNLQYRVNNAVPNQLTEFGDPLTTHSRVRLSALYAQEQWTRGRLTLQGAVRYDHAWSYFLDQQMGPSRFVPAGIDFPRTDGVTGFNDITPRMGIAYDLLGNGKTAVKVNLGKYLDPASVGGLFGLSNPTSRIATNVTRTWSDLNGNYLPDCNLLNPGAQDLRATGGDVCGAISNANFGTKVFSNTIDPALQSGWGVRGANWSFGASVQQQLFPRVSVEVGYFRRWDQNFTVTDNLAVAAADYGHFCITEPSDARLPGGGGATICDLYDVSPAKFGQVNNYVTRASNFGDQFKHWQGVDISLNARLKGGVTLQGGTSTGQTVTDNCEIRSVLLEIGPLNPYCHTSTGFITDARGLAVYRIPKVDVQISGTLQSKPLAAVAANYTVSNAVVAPSLGRNLAAGAGSNVTVNLVAPGEVYGNRINELDFRVAKILVFGHTRTTVGLDLYNAFNSSAVLSYNQTFIPNGTWPTPTSVLTARLIRIGAEIRF